MFVIFGFAALFSFSHSPLNKLNLYPLRLLPTLVLVVSLGIKLILLTQNYYFIISRTEVLNLYKHARRSNQSILKISPGCSLEGLMLRLKLQYFGHLMRRVDSLETTLMLGGVGGRRRRGRQRMRWLDGITNLMGMSLSKLRVGDGQGGLACCDSWGHKESERLNWTATWFTPSHWHLCYSIKCVVSVFNAPPSNVIIFLSTVMHVLKDFRG